jgi:hypothetical protein
MGWVVSATPWLLYPQGMLWYPLCKCLGESKGWSGWVWKFLIAPGFDHWIVQPVASCYTDYTILAHHQVIHMIKYGKIYCTTSCLNLNGGVCMCACVFGCTCVLVCVRVHACVCACLCAWFPPPTCTHMFYDLVTLYKVDKRVLL